MVLVWTKLKQTKSPKSLNFFPCATLSLRPSLPYTRIIFAWSFLMPKRGLSPTLRAPWMGIIIGSNLIWIQLVIRIKFSSNLILAKPSPILSYPYLNAHHKKPFVLCDKWLGFSKRNIRVGIRFLRWGWAFLSNKKRIHVSSWAWDIRVDTLFHL